VGKGAAFRPLGRPRPCLGLSPAIASHPSASHDRQSPGSLDLLLSKATLSTDQLRKRSCGDWIVLKVLPAASSDVSRRA
jgi:hypothetical protein